MRKLKPCLKPFVGCLFCGCWEMIQNPKTRIITCCLNEKMAGNWTVYRDGKVYYRNPNGCDSEEKYDECLTLGNIDRLAARKPEWDWRAVYYGGLRDATYQRQWKGLWVLVKSGKGYA